MAQEKNCILMEGIKRIFYSILKIIIVGQKWANGEVVAVDATCTSLQNNIPYNGGKIWGSLSAWGPIALLPALQLLGTDFKKKLITAKFSEINSDFDIFTRVTLIYQNAIASISVGKGVKSEGELIISGTQGYIYVPAPWWKTDYFEIRYENISENKRYFYQLDGEGIRYEIVAFLKSIETHKNGGYIAEDISIACAAILEDFNRGIDIFKI